jgi:Domain of unknown function (DUF4431)
VKAKVFTAFIVALTLASAETGQAQVSAKVTKSGCIDVSGAKARIVVSGKLTLQLFAGPPNFESIAKGDAEERTFILELPRRVCAYDGDEFADPNERFDRVHVSSSNPAMMRVLKAAVGRQIVAVGEAFSAHTGHHHAPLVILADRVTVR